MIKRIIILLEVLSKMSDSLYMLKWSSRSYFVRYTIILITSRDCNHITWFRNSASVSLLATLSHRTWIANDFFSSFQLFQKRSKISDCTFLKNFLQTKIFFLTHLLYTKSTFNSDRELYKKKWCDQMRIWFNFHWKTDSLFDFTDDCREDANKLLLSRRKKKDVNKFSQIVDTKNLIDSHKLLSRNVLLREKLIRFLKRREIE
jgi:hypothetical protein